PSFVGWGGGLEDRGHFDWLGFTDSSVNVSAEYAGPRVHTAPDFSAVFAPTVIGYDDPSLMPAPAPKAPRFDTGWWPAEHFARAAGPLVHADNQRAVFRREYDDWLFVAAT